MNRQEVRRTMARLFTFLEGRIAEDMEDGRRGNDAFAGVAAETQGETGTMLIVTASGARLKVTIEVASAGWRLHEAPLAAGCLKDAIDAAHPHGVEHPV
ncbi:MAG: hypothetical protein ACO1OK_10360 [Devosia sp.]